MANNIPSAQTVRNETTAGANTAERVGSVLEALASDNVVLDTISDLKSHEASVGDYAYVRYHSTVGDEGGGLFRLNNNAEFTHRDISFGVSVGSTYYLQFPNGIKRSVNIDDEIQFDSGVRVKVIDTNLGRRDYGSTSVQCEIITAGTMASGDQGWLVPGIEGVRVESTNVNVPNLAYWDRIGAGKGAMKLEWLGAQKSPSPTVFENSTEQYFNYAFERGYAIDLDAGYYYISSSINQVKPTAVIGKGGNRAELQTHTTENIDDKRGTTIYTNNNINMVNIMMSRCHWKDLTLNAIQVTPENNGSSYHDKWAFNYDLSYRVSNGIIDNVDIIGNIDALYTASMGTNGIRINSDDAQAVSGGGTAYFMRHTNMHMKGVNVGHQIDPDNDAENTDQACFYCDIDFESVKLAYKWLASTQNKITGTYFQDKDVLPFEERNLPIFQFHNCQAEVDLGTGDHAFGVDNAATEGESQYTYPRAHVSSQLYDIQNARIFIHGRAERNNVVSIKNNDYYVGDEYMRLDRQPAIWLHDLRQNQQEISAFDNMFRDADILRTVRTGLLDGSGIADFETETSEQIGTAPSSANLSWYSGTDSTLFRFSGGRGTFVNFGSASSTDFAEVVVEDAGGIQLEEVVISAHEFDSVQVIFYEGDTSGSGGITQSLVSTRDRLDYMRFNPPNGNIYKVIFRFIGASSSGLKQISDIFGYTHAISEDRVAPFIQRGMSPVMQSPDGTWWELQPPTNSGGTATWEQA